MSFPSDGKHNVGDEDLILPDTRSHRYNALKIYRRSSAQAAQVSREVEISKRLTTASTTHNGRSYVRKVLDSFEIENCGNHHRCLVHKPLWISLFDFQQLMKDKKFNEPTLKAVLNYLFVALDYLHTECQVIHTGMLLLCAI